MTRSVVCWGDNRFGQLGVAGRRNTTRELDFAPVDLGEPARARHRRRVPFVCSPGQRRRAVLGVE